MREYKQELQRVKEFFQSKGLGKRLNSSQELLYMLIGILNEDGTDFTDALTQRIGVDFSEDLDEFIGNYTVEVGAVMQLILQDVGSSMGNESGHETSIESIGKVVYAFLTLEKKEFLKNIVLLYQGEFNKLLNSKYYKNEAKQALNQLSQQSQLFTLDIKKIDTIKEENLHIIVILIIQDIFLCITVFQMQAMEDGEIPELITADEYADEIFDMREKLGEVVENSQDMIFNVDEFYFSTDTKPMCMVCKKNYASSGLQRHLGACVKKHIADDTLSTTLYQFKIYDKYMKDYYLHVLISKKAKLFHLDRFLREIWLECCGHMSSFYAQRTELDMGEPIEVLAEFKKVDYTYDFGSSTELTIEFKGEYKGQQDYYIKLLARNSEFRVKCHKCDKKLAKYICTECMFGGDEVILCKSCVTKHCDEYHESENYMMSRFVNSPRTGICGYESIDLDDE